MYLFKESHNFDWEFCKLISVISYFMSHIHKYSWRWHAWLHSRPHPPQQNRKKERKSSTWPFVKRVLMNMAKLSGNLKYAKRRKRRCDTVMSAMNNTSLKNIKKHYIKSCSHKCTLFIICYLIQFIVKIVKHGSNYVTVHLQGLNCLLHQL